MAFWGVEVKPGKPFTHFFDSIRGRLRISQATLGIGSATKRSLVQCNVGNKSPVLLCSLLPDKTESCSLDLEFEEADEVMFSVIGPRSVHLTGYYSSNGRHSNLNDDTDSYGEDIGNSESEESNHQSEEDEYDNSFIDDADPGAYPPSPLSDGEVASEDISDDIKPKNRKGRKRLKKKYQLSESDNDDNPRQQKVVNRRNGSMVLESEDEDSLPISSLYKTENTAHKTKLEGEKADKEIGERGKKKEEKVDLFTETNIKAEAVAVDEPERQPSLPFDSLKPSTEVATPEIDLKLKKKRKERSKEKKALEDCSLNNINVPEEDKTKQAEASYSMGHDQPLKNQQNQAASDKQPGLPLDPLKPSTEVAAPEIDMKPKKKRKERSKEKKALEDCSLNNINVLEEDETKQVEASNSMGHDPPLKNQQNQAANDKGDDLPHTCSLLPSTEISPENDARPKKKKRKRSKEVQNLEVDYVFHCNVLQEDRGQLEGTKADNFCQDQSVRNGTDSTPAKDKTLTNGEDHFAGEKQSEERKIKKKKRSKTQENVNTNVPPLSTNEMNIPIMNIEEENSHPKSSKVRTLSNGLTIEELEMGKPDGKVASQGKKLSVRYIGKLKENGHVFDSKIDGAPYKFCLGKGEVIEGWDIGLDGMRVGDKRRLTIPPSMGFGSKGDNENVPPNAWLVYEIELISAR